MAISPTISNTCINTCSESFCQRKKRQLFLWLEKEETTLVFNDRERKDNSCGQKKKRQLFVLMRERKDNSVWGL